MVFENIFENINKDPAGTGAGSSQSGSPAPLPKGLDQIIAAIESVTGKSRDKLAADVAIAATKGQLEEFFNTLIPGIGKSPTKPPESRFMRHVKFCIVWIPAGVVLFGFAIVLVIWFAGFLL